MRWDIPGSTDQTFRISVTFWITTAMEKTCKYLLYLCVSIEYVVYFLLCWIIHVNLIEITIIIIITVLVISVIATRDRGKRQQCGLRLLTWRFVTYSLNFHWKNSKTHHEIRNHNIYTFLKNSRFTTSVQIIILGAPVVRFQFFSTRSHLLWILYNDK